MAPPPVPGAVTVKDIVLDDLSIAVGDVNRPAGAGAHAGPIPKKVLYQIWLAWLPASTRRAVAAGAVGIDEVFLQGQRGRCSK